MYKPLSNHDASTMQQHTQQQQSYQQKYELKAIQTHHAPRQKRLSIKKDQAQNYIILQAILELEEQIWDLKGLFQVIVKATQQNDEFASGYQKLMGAMTKSKAQSVPMTSAFVEHPLSTAARQTTSRGSKGIAQHFQKG